MRNSKQLSVELESSKLVAIIRADNAEGLVDVAKALEAGGVKFIEVTMTTPGALEILRQAEKALPGCHLGVGSVLDATTARLSRAATTPRHRVDSGYEPASAGGCRLDASVLP